MIAKSIIYNSLSSYFSSFFIHKLSVKQAEICPKKLEKKKMRILLAATIITVFVMVIQLDQQVQGCGFPMGGSMGGGGGGGQCCCCPSGGGGGGGCVGRRRKREV